MRCSNALGCTLLIFALGVFAGLLIAPRKGEETRKILRERMEECCNKTCKFIGEKQGFFFMKRLDVFLFFRQDNPRCLGKELDRFRKSDALDSHDKGKDISARTAAKTVKYLHSGIDAKRRGFFLMKGTNPKKVLALLF